MATSTEIVPQKNRNARAARVGWAVLIVATLFTCYFSQLGAIGFVGPDEPRYAWVAREMGESGDWITPRLYGKPWFEKPPLYYWGAALAFKVLGVSEAAARLPSAIFALLATLAMGWLAWRVYGRETARWLLLLLPTTVAMVGFSHAAATDMPFAGMLTAAMVCAAVILGMTGDPVVAGTQHSLDGLADVAAPLQTSTFGLRRSWFVSVLFGAFLGLAVLAKGPAALILCGGGVFFWALLTKRWRDTFRLLHPAGIAAFCLTALPWYILCARRNPEFFHVFIVEHNFKRYLTPEFQHIQPFWFYLPVLALALLPWTLVLLPAIGDSKALFRRKPRPGAAAIFLASWAIFVLAFFSLSQSKLPGYILPGIPPLLLLCSRAVTKLVAGPRPSRFLLFVTSGIAFLMIVAGSVDALWLHRLSDLQEFAQHSVLRVTLLGLAICLALLGVVLALTNRRPLCLLCSVSALVIFLASADLTRLDAAVSPRQTSQVIEKIRKPGEEVLLCEMRRSYAYAFDFYLHEELSDWKQHNPQRPALVVIGSPACWSELTSTKYQRLPETNSTRWDVIEVQANSAGGLAPGRQAQ